jgi:hypothetical protein
MLLAKVDPDVGMCNERGQHLGDERPAGLSWSISPGVRSSFAHGGQWKEPRTSTAAYD